MTMSETSATPAREGEQFNKRQLFFMRVAMKLITATNMRLLKLTGGRVGYSFLGRSVLLLHTRGCKSGKAYQTPLFYMEDGENLVLVASRAGTTINPGWLRNLEADPSTQVRLRSGMRSVRAHLASDEEYARLWPLLTEMFEQWGDIQAKTQRRFPIIVLEPAAGGSQD